MNQPLVSIIIPVFNRADLIKTAINSVIKQTYSNWECIVIDDGSQDQTIQIVKVFCKKDDRIKIHQRSRLPKGAPTCRNIGLDQAKGSYIVYLDSDDYLLPFCLKTRIEAFNQNPNNDFLIFPMGELKNGTIEKKEIPPSEDYLINFLSAILPWSIMCPIWKKTSLQSLKGFTEGYLRFNDPELMIRALLKSQVNYKVFRDLDHDTVYIPSPKQRVIFNKKVHKSLIKFIPDTVKNLHKNKKTDKKKYLALYLHLWFKYFYLTSSDKSIRPSLKLINLFKNNGVITGSKSINLKMRVYIYATSSLLLNQPIDKLSERALYI